MPILDKKQGVALHEILTASRQNGRDAFNSLVLAVRLCCSKEYPPMSEPDEKLIGFQCPNCGQDLKQSIRQIRANQHMTCSGCGIGINIDTDRLAKAVDEIQKAMDKIPPEITIKFFRSDLP